MDLFQDSSFWVAISFVIFCVICYVYGRKSALAIVDDYIAHIRTRIAEAELLHKKAEEQAKDVAARFAGAEKEAADILAQASKEAADILAVGSADLQKRLASRQKQFDAEMKQLEDSAINELRARMAALVEEMTREQLKAALNKDAQNALIDHSIKTAGEAAKAA